MDIIHLVLLGLVQGITEFLPISSSAHLILLPGIMGWQDQGIVYDIAAHLGSLIAVIIYFRRDILNVIRPWMSHRHEPEIAAKRPLLIYIITASIPIAIVGFLFYDLISNQMRSAELIASASIFFGLLLFWADKTGVRMKTFSQLKLDNVLVIGLAQALSLIPGTSRSGITMTAALMMGFDRKAAARFSFLLAIPTILMAGGYQALRYFTGESMTDWGAFLIVALVSCISAYIAIHVFLKFIESTGMLPYVIYRILLGLLIFIVV